MLDVLELTTMADKHWSRVPAIWTAWLGVCGMWACMPLSMCLCVPSYVICTLAGLALIAAVDTTPKTTVLLLTHT